MMPTFILLIFLSGGGMRVYVAPTLFECLMRSSFEIRFNPSVKTMCVPHEGSWA